MEFIKKIKSDSAAARQQTLRRSLLGNAITDRRFLEASRSWWQQFLNVNADVQEDVRVREIRLGDQVVTVFRDSSRFDFDPITGNVSFNETHPIYAIPDRAILYFTPPSEMGRQFNAKRLAILGDAGIKKLLGNLANKFPPDKGFRDLEIDDQISKYLPWVVAAFGAWVMSKRYGLETILGTMSYALSLLRSLLGV